MNLPLFTSVRLMHLRKLYDFLSKQARTMQELRKILSLTERPIKELIIDLRTSYGYKIEYNRKTKKYVLFADLPSRNLLTDVATDENRFHEVRITLGLSQNEFLDVLKDLGKGKVIQIEDSTQTAGLQHIPVILKALREKQVIAFDYQKLTDDTPVMRVVVPYIVKEFRNEWHLVGAELEKDGYEWSVEEGLENGWLKFYNLSKIEKVQIPEPQPYNYIEKTDIYDSNKFLNCYGAFINEVEGTIEDVVLAFTPQYKKHFENKKFHPTQEILPREVGKFCIKLRLHVGHYGIGVEEYNQDLLKDLASYGRQVKVISPPHLAEALKGYLQKALEQYT